MFLNLVHQVQKALRLINGGTGNEYGLARGTIFRALQYSGGATLAVGSTVKRAPYNYTSVAVTTDTDDTVLGVSVGTMSDSDDSIDPATATPSNGSVAVAVSGIVDVRLGADVTAGQYAFAHATDGTAYGSASRAGASFGQFLTSGTTGNKAKVLLQTGSGVSDHGGLTGLADNDHPQYSQSDHTHVGLGAVWRPVMAQNPSDSKWYVVVAADGTAVVAED